MTTLSAPIPPASFELLLPDTPKTVALLEILSPLEAMFNAEENTLPPEYFAYTADVPLGTIIKVSFEVVRWGKDSQPS